MMQRRIIGRALVLVAVAALGVAGTAVPGSAGSNAAGKSAYVVVLKAGDRGAGVRAIAQAGGTIESINKLGIARVASTNASFAAALGRTGNVQAVGDDAMWNLGALEATEAAFPDPATQAGTCAAQYGVATTVGPDPLSVCQWDMRIIHASPSGSYDQNQGDGVTIGIIDTGLDFAHPDLAPNIDVGLSCSFITSSNPNADPAEVANGDCSKKSAVQDLAGHGTHVAGEAAGAINGVGIAGVAPEATIVGLKAGNINGYFFTQEVVDALIYAGDHGIDVVNMSFFADPWLFNCRNDADQRAIIQAISRAAIYASSHGVVMIAAAGNEGIDLNHPVTDTISPDFPPNSEQARDVGNYCVVLPQEIPGVAAVSAIGPKGILSFYSTYGNFVAVTAPGGSSLQAPNPFGRVLNAWSSTAPPTAGGNETRTVEDCSGGPCVRWAWVQGTSMASPHAAGVAALILSAHPNLAPGAVIARLGTTAMPMECPEVQDVAPPDFPEKTCTGGGTHTTFYGSGLVDALAAGA